MTKESFKRIAMLALGSFCYASSFAVPAAPQPMLVTQPDGSTLMVRQNGDEYHHWRSTTDGYSIVKNDKGFYVYAALEDGALVPTDVVACDAEKRDAAQVAFLASTPKNLVPAITTEAAEMRAVSRSMQQGAQLKATTKQYDYNNFRGLVLLVEFNDCPFSRSDYATIVNDMINAKNFTGFMNTGVIPSKIEYTGSVRDYFYDNSFGKFDPQFDVVGPVKVDYSMYDPQAVSGVRPIVLAAYNAAYNNFDVDFSKYDCDNDGYVDMIYLIFSGAGANFAGNDQRFVWPHASSYTKKFDGVYTSRYACSTELYGAPENKLIDGIGTICHEFSHCLGLADEYDTDYDGSGGQSLTPNGWSVMSGGSYFNYARTPVGYSLFQRYQSGFAVPTVIENAGEYTLESIDATNTGYRLNTPTKKEYFLLENRRKTKWNSPLPGEGMLIFRVDSTSTTPWYNNTVNCNPKHNYYELLRASVKKYYGQYIDSDGDPFPGSAGITAIDNYTTPNLKTWSGLENEISLSDIADVDGVIKFNANIDLTPKDVEDFENMNANTSNGTYENVKGNACTWSIVKGSIVETTTEAGNGKRMLALLKRGTATTSKFAGNVSKVRFTVYNKTSSRAVIKLYYSLDDGATWTAALNPTGEDLEQVAGNTTTPIIFNTNLDQPAMFRIELYSGNSLNATNFDDIQFFYGESSAVEANFGDQTDVKSYREGDYIVLAGVEPMAEVTAYSVSGAAVAKAQAIDGVVRLCVPIPGLYVISDGVKTIKVLR